MNGHFERTPEPWMNSRDGLVIPYSPIQPWSWKTEAPEVSATEEKPFGLTDRTNHGQGVA
jgi:hypothetical protein